MSSVSIGLTTVFGIHVHATKCIQNMCKQRYYTYVYVLKHYCQYYLMTTLQEKSNSQGVTRIKYKVLLPQQAFTYICIEYKL